MTLLKRERTMLMSDDRTYEEGVEVCVALG